MGIIGRFMFVMLFCSLMAMVAAWIFMPEVRNIQASAVIIICLGMFTVLFGFASLVVVEKQPTAQARAAMLNPEDLHRAYGAGYELVDRQYQRQLEYQERAYQAQIASQERQHRTTVGAFVQLSLADKQTVREALLAGIRLVEYDRQLVLRFADGHIQPVSQIEDMTPDKLRYIAAAQQQLPAAPRRYDTHTAVEADYREI